MDVVSGSSTAAPAAQAEISVAAGSSLSPGHMARVISGFSGSVPLGETEIGQSWCLKALHPADTTVLSSPMPVNETKAFASVAFTQTDTMSIPATFDPAKPWNAIIYVHRDPCLLYSYQFYQAGVASVIGYQFSWQYGAGSYAGCFQALRTNAEKIRLSSQSMTAYFDGASESDAGHITACQYESPRYNLASTAFPALVGEINATVPFTYYQDRPPYVTEMTSATKSFQTPARNGVYCPSKLVSLGQWINTNQSFTMLGCSDPAAGALASEFQTIGLSRADAAAPANTFYNTFPFMTKVAGDGFPLVYGSVDPGITMISFQGMSATSNLRLTMRWSLDVMVRPATVWAPFVRMPPVEDHMALKMYAQVSRQMADGYPGSYNALGALLPIIAKIAASVLPSVVPAIGSWLSGKDQDRAEMTRSGMTAPRVGFVENLTRKIMGAPGYETSPEDVKILAPVQTRMYDQFLAPLIGTTRGRVKAKSKPRKKGPAKPKGKRKRGRISGAVALPKRKMSKTMRDAMEDYADFLAQR